MLAVQQERKEDCEYLVKITDEIPDDRITYHTCRLADLDQPCAYPAKYCKFKEELEQFTQWARETILRTI